MFSKGHHAGQGQGMTWLTPLGSDSYLRSIPPLCIWWDYSTSGQWSCCELLQITNYYKAQGKEMFSEASFCQGGLLVTWGLPQKRVCLWRGCASERGPASRGSASREFASRESASVGGGVCPTPPVLTSNLGYCSSRYACYWNAILLRIITRMHSSRMRTACSISRLLWGGGICFSACWDTPWVLASRPPWVWALRPHQARPLNFPPGCGPGDLQGMLGYHPPLVNRILDTRFWKYYLAPTSLRAVMIVVSSHYYLCHWNCKRISSAVKCEDQTGWWKYCHLE